MNKRKLKRVLRQVLSEMNMNKYYDRMPESALDRLIPAGHLEDILNTDGLREFMEELAFYCEMLENGEEPYHVMEPAEQQFVLDAIQDFADDGDMDFAKWLEKSAFDMVFIGDENAAMKAAGREPNFVRWTMR